MRFARVNEAKVNAKRKKRGRPKVSAGAPPRLRGGRKFCPAVVKLRRLKQKQYIQKKMFCDIAWFWKEGGNKKKRA